MRVGARAAVPMLAAPAVRAARAARQSPLGRAWRPRPQRLPEEAAVPGGPLISALAASAARQPPTASRKAVWAVRHHSRALLEAPAVQLQADSVSAGVRVAPLTLTAWLHLMALILNPR